MHLVGGVDAVIGLLKVVLVMPERVWSGDLVVGEEVGRVDLGDLGRPGNPERQGRQRSQAIGDDQAWVNRRGWLAGDTGSASRVE